MKLLIFLTVLFCYSTAICQGFKSHPMDVTPKFPLYHYDLNHTRTIYLFDNSLMGTQNSQSWKRSFGGLVLLPQDNMPCIVPPLTSMSPMPNFWSTPLMPMTGIMPNPAPTLDINKLPLLSWSPVKEQTIPIR